MAFELLRGKLTPEPETIPKHEVMPVLRELAVGDVHFIHQSELLVDQGGSLQLCLDAALPEYGPDELSELYRVVRTPIGFVLDRSHSYMERSNPEALFGVYRTETWADPGNSAEVVPVIGLINTPAEFKIAAGILKEQFDIELHPLDTTVM